MIILPSQLGLSNKPGAPLLRGNFYPLKHPWYNSNATSHPNIGSLKTAFEEEGNKMSEEFILKAGKLFRKKW